MSHEARKSAPEARQGPVEYAFKLYVSTASPISQRAIANARNLLQQLLPGRHSLVVLNIAEHVEAARADQVIASPTLLVVAPLPQRRFIGDLANGDQLRQALGLRAPEGD